MEQSVDNSGERTTACSAGCQRRAVEVSYYEGPQRKILDTAAVSLAQLTVRLLTSRRELVFHIKVPLIKIE
jgi:hypothetical protein